MSPPRTPRTMIRVEAIVKPQKQVQSLTYLEGAITETPDVPTKIVRRNHALSGECAPDSAGAKESLIIDEPVDLSAIIKGTNREYSEG